ncbi:UDP-N-acetylmuramoyl-tripeptide--D-alanyl-D-alanine ligase [Cerasicoccus fimbriatus]|uniref:UDP-N-acetylmuramoyl-tripeptide--D-alanyl-D- alanine ligase n=1 Tax=Cerasicoccus fimbriatus TaxID=3014554 RepID=UPI0022B54C6D|nr:UDP-N-acetylmuramoyl-tripeptide--D-alanyl-D-alanine ligase [Cerasicoccus sp. TK19100]
MPRFSPQLLADWTAGKWLGTTPDKQITGFCQDTRKLKPGDCFVALETEQRDGHAFLASARDAGATAALVSKPRDDINLPQLYVGDSLGAFQTIACQHRHAFPGQVVGVTGSCGKTSTKDLIARLLGDECLKTEKNLNNTIGVPLTLTQLDAEKHRYAVVEAGINQPGEMSTLAAMISPDVSVVTMIGPAHLEKLGSQENIAREKAELVRLSAPGSSLLCSAGCLQYPAFHQFGGEIFSVCQACGEDSTLDYTEYHSCFRFFREGQGTRVQVKSALFAGQFTIDSHLTKGMVSNAVLAVLTAILCGAKWETVKQRLQGWKPGADRGSIYLRGDDLFYVDCYNANPASMTDALETFATLAPPDAPRLYVLGGMKELGEHAEALHRKVGADVPLRAQDRAVLIGAEAEAYAEGLREAGASASQVTVFDSSDVAQDAMGDFHGSIFVKGSRAYALESLLPEGLMTRKETAAC